MPPIFKPRASKALQPSKSAKQRQREEKFAQSLGQHLPLALCQRVVEAPRTYTHADDQYTCFAEIADKDGKIRLSVTNMQHLWSLETDYGHWATHRNSIFTSDSSDWRILEYFRRAFTAKKSEKMSDETLNRDNANANANANANSTGTGTSNESDESDDDSGDNHHSITFQLQDRDEGDNNHDAENKSGDDRSSGEGKETGAQAQTGAYGRPMKLSFHYNIVSMRVSGSFLLPYTCQTPGMNECHRVSQRLFHFLLRGRDGHFDSSDAGSSSCNSNSNYNSRRGSDRSERIKKRKRGDGSAIDVGMGVNDGIGNGDSREVQRLRQRVASLEAELRNRISASSLSASASAYSYSSSPPSSSLSLSSTLVSHTSASQSCTLSLSSPSLLLSSSSTSSTPLASAPSRPVQKRNVLHPSQRRRKRRAGGAKLK